MVWPPELDQLYLSSGSAIYFLDVIKQVTRFLHPSFSLSGVYIYFFSGFIEV